MAPHFEIYEERDAAGYKSSGQWRWRFIAGNGENTANGSEGYASEGNVRHAVLHHCLAVVEMCAASVVSVDDPVITVVDE